MMQKEDPQRGAASMSGGDRADASAPEPSRNEAAPAGRTSPAGEELGPIGMESANGGPPGAHGNGEHSGSGGSFGTGTYTRGGNMTGPDSPAGSDAGLATGNEGQGDDLANRLGGGDRSRAGLTGAGAATGDASAGRSERTETSAQDAAGAGGPSAGDVGGMGGVRGHTAGSGRPPGGVSPMEGEKKDRE